MASFVYEPLPPEQIPFAQRGMHPNDLARFSIQNVAPSGEGIYNHRMMTQHHRPYGANMFKDGSAPTRRIEIAQRLDGDPLMGLSAFSNDLFETPMDREENLVRTGTIYNPYTGETMDTFEEAMPPPTGDYSVPSYERAKSNMKLVYAQGGFDQNAPRRSKVEVFEDLPTMADGPNVFGDALYADARRAEMAGRVGRDLFHNRNGNQNAFSDVNVVDGHKTGFVGYQNMLRPVPYMPQTQRDRQEIPWFAGVDADSIPNPRVGDRELVQGYVNFKGHDLSENLVRPFGNMDGSALGDQTKMQNEYVSGIGAPLVPEDNTRIYGNITATFELPTVILDPAENPLKAVYSKGHALHPNANVQFEQGNLVYGEQNPALRQDAQSHGFYQNMQPSHGDTGGWTTYQMNPTLKQDARAPTYQGNFMALAEAGWTASQEQRNTRQPEQSAHPMHNMVFETEGGWVASQARATNKQVHQGLVHNATAPQEQIMVQSTTMTQLAPQRSTGVQHAPVLNGDGSQFYNPNRDYASTQVAKVRGVTAIETAFGRLQNAYFEEGQMDTDRQAVVDDNEVKRIDTLVRTSNPEMQVGNVQTAERVRDNIFRGYHDKAYDISTVSQQVIAETSGGNGRNLDTLLNDKLGSTRGLSDGDYQYRRGSTAQFETGAQPSLLTPLDINVSTRRPSFGGRDPSGDIYQQLARQVRDGTYV